MLLAVSPHTALAASASDAQSAYLKAIDRMMVELAPQSSWASQSIKQLYRGHMDLLVLSEFAALEGGLATGGVAPLPPNPLAFNIKPRVDGMFPIGEKDLLNQASYIAARAATLGALIEVASRVASGPVEVTSLVRHLEYQDALRATNSNANTSVPTHTMGLAFDIALVNTPLATVHEIRDVLIDMQRAGDILVIGERKQLVFHVVPHPSRLGHFEGVYRRAMAEAVPGANIITSAELGERVNAPLVPSVAAEVIQIRPTDEFAREWWAAADAQSDLIVKVAAPGSGGVAPSAPEASGISGFARRGLRALGGWLQAAWGLIA